MSRKSSGGLCSAGGPKERTICWSYKECTGERSSSITKKFRGGLPLQATAQNRRGCYRMRNTDRNGDSSGCSGGSVG